MRRSRPIGLDIGERAIVAAQLAGGRDAGLAVCAVVPRREGAELADDMRRLGKILSRQGFRGDAAVIAAPPEKLLLAPLELPPAGSGAPLGKLAAAEVARVFKRDAASIAVAWWETPTATEGAAASPITRGLGAGLGREDAAALSDAVRWSGLRVEAIDARPWALVRAAGRKAGSGGALLVVLELAWEGAHIAIAQGETLVFARTLPDAAIRNLQAATVRDLRLAPEVADYVLFGAGPEPGTPPDRLPRAVIDAFAQPLAAEVRASIDYVRSRHRGGDGESETIHLAGLGAGVAELGEAVGFAAGAPVQRVSLPAIGAGAAAPPRAACAFGLATYDARRAGVAA